MKKRNIWITGYYAIAAVCSYAIGASQSGIADVYYFSIISSAGLFALIWGFSIFIRPKFENPLRILVFLLFVFGQSHALQFALMLGGVKIAQVFNSFAP